MLPAGLQQNLGACRHTERRGGAHADVAPIDPRHDRVERIGYEDSRLDVSLSGGRWVDEQIAAWPVATRRDAVEHDDVGVEGIWIPSILLRRDDGGGESLGGLKRRLEKGAAGRDEQHLDCRSRWGREHGAVVGRQAVSNRDLCAHRAGALTHCGEEPSPLIGVDLDVFVEERPTLVRDQEGHGAALIRVVGHLDEHLADIAIQGAGAHRQARDADVVGGRSDLDVVQPIGGERRREAGVRGAVAEHVDIAEWLVPSHRHRREHGGAEIRCRG